MSPSRLMFVFALLMSLFMLLTVPALAQYGAGLQGTVQDKSGAVVSGATVTATENATAVNHTATSNWFGPRKWGMGRALATGVRPDSHQLDHHQRGAFQFHPIRI